MKNSSDPSAMIQTVSISTRGLPDAGDRRAMQAPCWSRPRLRLGASSPFGLALPDAQPSASTMYAPRSVWLDERRLIVCDSGNHRILIWNRVPAVDETPADVVLGQPSLDSEGPAARGRGPENGLRLPTGVLVAERKLLVADAWHHRVLVWNTIPTASDTPPDYAIGQADLSQVEVNRAGPPSRRSLYWPYGITYSGTRLCVADTGNRRVLIWNGIPGPDQPADVLIGQSCDSASDENRGGPVAANSFRWPHDFAFVGDHFFVADAGNHRILGWNLSRDNAQRRDASKNTKPARIGRCLDRPADYVLGQQDFDSAFELPYDAQGPRRLRFPYAIDSCGDVLAAADTANNRILFWRIPLADDVYPAAFDVLGQLDFAANGENRWESVAADTLCWPYGICFHDGTLAVADTGNNRVMLWDVRPVVDPPSSENPPCA